MNGMKLTYSFLFLALGIAAIAAALKYTIGKNPYGYIGLGDVFVFLFFGLVGVMGTYFLHTHQFTVLEWLPAISIGCFSTGVLNLNNLRDRENDAAFGKQTVVVKLGVKKAKMYHAALLITGMMATVVYTLLTDPSVIRWIYLISFAGMIKAFGQYKKMNRLKHWILN